MKGPSLRLDETVRRTFACPECGKTLVRDGGVTALWCEAGHPPTAMRLDHRVAFRRRRSETASPNLPPLPTPEAD